MSDSECKGDMAGHKEIFMFIKKFFVLITLSIGVVFKGTEIRFV